MYDNEGNEYAASPSDPNEEKLTSIYRSLNPKGKNKLIDRAEELVDLGYTEDTAESSTLKIS